MYLPALRPNRSLRWVAPCAIAFAVASCSDDDDGPSADGPEEQELITTVGIQFAPAAGDPVTFTFTDLDGDGGDDGVFGSDGTLDSGTVYAVTTVFLNEAEDPAENVTAEIIEEDEEHQVFYIVDGGLDMTVVAVDQDDDGRPVGVLATATAGAPSSGTLRVVLRHEPDKDAAGVADGDIANAGGETDIQVDFPVEIE